MVRIQHILCPVDFSDFSRHAFDCAVGMARNYGADVTVLHVLPVPSLVPALPYGPEGPGPFGFETVGRERALVELKQFLNLDSVGVPVHFRIAEGPSVHNEILLQTSRLSADLVVMGTHGRSGFDRLMLGSAAEKTLRASRVPVLIVPPRTPEAPAFSRDAFRHVLCAVDFSQDSARALGYAVSLARRAGGDLTLVHVVEPIPLGYDPMRCDADDSVIRSQFCQVLFTGARKLTPGNCNRRLETPIPRRWHIRCPVGQNGRHAPGRDRRVSAGGPHANPSRSRAGSGPTRRTGARC
jgi:nucleotide-binding universal stress UspA family protein